MATDLAYGHGSDNWLAWWLCSFLYKTLAQQTQPVRFVLARNSTGNVSPVGQALLKSPQTYSQWQKKVQGNSIKSKKTTLFTTPPLLYPQKPQSSDYRVKQCPSIVWERKSSYSPSSVARTMGGKWFRNICGWGWGFHRAKLNPVAAIRQNAFTLFV